MIAAVDRLLDMCCTSANVTGDTVTAVMVAKSEGVLDMARYNSAGGIAVTDSVVPANAGT